MSTAEAGTERLSCHAVERVICEIWSGYFGRDVLPYDDFYDLGGDSLGMIDIVGQARELGLPVRSSMALRNPSPARLAECLTIGADATPVAVPALCSDTGVAGPVAPVSIVAADTAEPLYVVHSDSHVETERDAIASWDSPRPVKGFALAGGSISALADRVLAALRQDQPDGPYRLAGFGHGAVLAFELASRLRQLSAHVPLLVMINPPAVDVAEDATRESLLQRRLAMLASRFGLTGEENAEEIHARMRLDGWYGHVTAPDLAACQSSFVDLELSVRDYVPAGYDGPAVLFQDGADSAPWRHAIADLEIHRLDYGIESPTAVIRDTELALFMRKALQG